MNKKCQISLVNPGDKFSRLSYLEVVSSLYGRIRVKNQDGIEWDISDNIFAEECYSANQFTETREVTRSELIEIFNQTEDNIYTVCFNKQPKVEDAFEAVANKGKIKSNAEIKKALKKQMTGEERILVGYTIKREVAWGRSMVCEIGKPKDDNIRQVDHRTLNWLICKNVKYVVRG